MHQFCSLSPGRAGAEILPQRPSPARFIATRVSQASATQLVVQRDALKSARPLARR